MITGKITFILWMKSEKKNMKSEKKNMKSLRS